MVWRMPTDLQLKAMNSIHRGLLKISGGRLGWRAGDFPHAERVGRNILTLPLFPAMSNEDVDRVCQELREMLH